MLVDTGLHAFDFQSNVAFAINGDIEFLILGTCSQSVLFDDALNGFIVIWCLVLLMVQQVFHQRGFAHLSWTNLYVKMS